MGFDSELEEILNSIKNKDSAPVRETTPIDLPPPKKKTDFSLREVEAPEKADEKAPEIPEKAKPVKEEKKAGEPEEKPEKKAREKKPLPEKKEKVKKEKPVKEKPEAEPKPEKDEKLPEPKKDKPKKEKPKAEPKPEKEKPKAEPKPGKEKPEKVKSEKKKGEGKAKPSFKELIHKKSVIAAAAVVLVLLIGAGIFLINKSMYLKRYEEKYGISFPKGIPEELCDYYGQNQSLAGSIVIKDNDSETPVFSSPSNGEALFERGSSIDEDQHYRAAALNVSDVDLEALYKTPEGYVSSTQSFTFKTIYGEKQKYHVIAAYIVNTRPEDDNGYAFPYNAYGNFTEDSYSHYQDTIKRRSLYDTGYKIKETDYCMTLSVESDIMPFFRFVIVGVKVDRVDKITETKENKMIRYPQAYCDKLGIHNIFNFAYDWYPEIITNAQNGATKQLTAEDFE